MVLFDDTYYRILLLLCCVVLYCVVMHNNLSNYVLHCVWMILVVVCTTYIIFLFVKVFWCPGMAINVSVQYNGGLLPDIILLTQCYYHQGTRSNVLKKFCFCSLWCHLNVLTFPPLIGGCSEGLGAFRFFLKKYCNTACLCCRL